jgi:histidinol-phosphate aminotransferase
MSALRPDLEDLPRYAAGGASPGRLRLASNETAFGPLPGVRRALAEAAAAGEGEADEGGASGRYPDFASTALRDALAERLGVTREEVAVGCGSSALCYDAARAACPPGAGGAVAGPWRSFEAYPILAGVVGAAWRPVPLAADHGLDLAALLAEAAAPRTRLVFLCNPNNPTGTAFGPRQLARFLDAAPPDTLVVLDEAYFEFAGPEAADGVQHYLRHRPQNLAVLRTFSKAYGLAGLRVGYCVAAPRIIAGLHAVQVPFAVNALAQRAALAALGDGPEVRRRCAETARARDAMAGKLRAAGFEVPPSHANFVWLPLGAAAADFARHCAEREIAVRAFPGDGVRVTVGTAAQCDEFVEAATAFVPRGQPAGPDEPVVVVRGTR